jgi:hypothetical protein
MRCSQPQGLPKCAEEFLTTNAVKVNECPQCGRYGDYERKIIGTYGMFDELELYRYTLRDGTTIDEFIQEEIWDSGPMIWLALRWKDTTFEWPKDAMVT